MTGKRGLIAEPTNDVLRGAGHLSHRLDLGPAHGARRRHVLLARAGALRALAPTFALLWPVKKIAAVAAMVGADDLLHLLRLRRCDGALARHDARDVRRDARRPAGPEHAQPRRSRPSIVLAREPEALLGPSFQMSFGAVAALMALVPLLHRARSNAGAASRARAALALAGGQRVGLADHDLGREPRDGAVLRLSLPDPQPLRPCRQRAGAAARLAGRHAVGGPRRAGLSVRARPAASGS